MQSLFFTFNFKGANSAQDRMDLSPFTRRVGTKLGGDSCGGGISLEDAGKATIICNNKFFFLKLSV